ncbi:hypothetical protein ACFL59_09645, partial [Planctomycetota bacterium]
MKIHIRRILLAGAALLLVCSPLTAQNEDFELCEARYQGFIEGAQSLLQVKRSDEQAYAYKLHPSEPRLLQEIKDMEGGGILQRGVLVEIELIKENGAWWVTRVERIDAEDSTEFPPDSDDGGPSIIPGPTEQQKTPGQEWAETLGKGDRVEVQREGNSYTFLEYRRGDLKLETIVHGKKVTVFQPARDLIYFKTIKKRRTAEGTDGDGDTGEEFRFSKWYEIIDAGGNVYTGYVIGKDSESVTLSLTGGLGDKEIERSRIRKSRPLTGDELQEIASRAKRVKEAQGEDEGEEEPEIEFVEKVHKERGEFKLDPITKISTLKITVGHDEAEQLLRGAELRLVLRGQMAADRNVKVEGRFSSPDKEKEVLAYYHSKRKKIPKEHFTHPVDGLKYCRIKIDDQYHLVELESNPLEQREIQLAVIFPGRPAYVSLTTRIVNPAVEVMEVLYDPEKDFVPYDDPRAVTALIEAYSAADRSTSEDLVWDAAVRGMERCGDERLIPFLFWEHYMGTRAQPSTIEKALADFGGAAETWLVGRLSDEGWAKPVMVPTLEGVDEPRIPRNPNLALASSLRILRAMGTTNTDAFLHAIAHVRSKDEEVETAAIALFVDRPDPPLSKLIQYLSRELAEAKDVILELEGKKPGTLQRIYHDILKIKDAGFVQEAMTLQRKERDKAFLKRISDYAKKNRYNLVDELVDGADSSSTIQAFLGDLDTLQARAAAGMVAQAAGKPPRQADHRHWRTALLRKALLLDPNSEQAKVALAGLIVEVIEELKSGAWLRQGPGEDWGTIERLSGDTIYLMTAEGGKNAHWIPVKHADGVSYVHRSCVKVGKRSVLAVSNTRRPEHVLSVINQAIALDPERGATLEADRTALEAIIAAEASEAGQWFHALRTYQDAVNHRPTMRLRLGLLSSYLHNKPWVPATGLALFFVFMAALLSGKRGPTKE